MQPLIKPLEIKCKNMDGKELTFIIHRIPATYAREIITQYPTTAMPKLGNYEENEKLMIKLMGYVVAVNDAGIETRLSNRHLIDNHVTDLDALAKIEYEMLKYNSNFFNLGKISKALKGFEPSIRQLVTQTLMRWSAPSSAKEKQPSKN